MHEKHNDVHTVYNQVWMGLANCVLQNATNKQKHLNSINTRHILKIST